MENIQQHGELVGILPLMLVFRINQNWNQLAGLLTSLIKYLLSLFILDFPGFNTKLTRLYFPGSFPVILFLLFKLPDPSVDITSRGSLIALMFFNKYLLRIYYIPCIPAKVLETQINWGIQVITREFVGLLKNRLGWNLSDPRFSSQTSCLQYVFIHKAHLCLPRWVHSRTVTLARRLCWNWER